MHGDLGSSSDSIAQAQGSLQMFGITSLANKGETDFLLYQYNHGFPETTGRPISSSENHVLGFLKLEPIEGGAGDQQSGVTNMSNITSTSGDASGSSGGREMITNGADTRNRAPQLQTSAIAATGAAFASNGLTVVAKRKRNLPGTPDPDAEVIALSPRTLTATNRFVCEICNKGFQRDQNLQLHRRGHNLPWKLKQRSSKEIRKRVYICPEQTCVHHDPARALGDLTGVKKHFCRKHGEKKWKCDKCSKRYAVQSDWKAHSKTCGTREYRCDCGTFFSRRDSFITHRAFCDALAEESARANMDGGLISGNSSLALQGAGGSGPLMSTYSPLTTCSLSRQVMAGFNSMTNTLASSPRCNMLGVPSSNIDSGLFASSSSQSRARLSLWLGKDPAGASDASQVGGNDHFLLGSTDRLGSGPESMASLFRTPDSFGGSKFLTSVSGMQSATHHSLLAPGFTDLGSFAAMSGSSLSGLSELGGFPGWPEKACASQLHVVGLGSNLQTSAAVGFTKGTSLSSLPSMSSLLSKAHASPSAQTSATALLQKAARMGATASNSSFLIKKELGNSGRSSCALRSTSGNNFAGGSLMGLTAGLMAPSNAPSLQHGPFNLVVEHEKVVTPSGYDASTHGRSAASNGNEATVISNPANAAGGGTAKSSMAPPASLTPATSHLFGRFSDKKVENRSPNSPTRDQLSEARYSAGGQQQAKLNALSSTGWSSSSNIPKSEDGVTRDFLGVRGLKTLVAGAQDIHAASAMANSLSRRDPTVMYPLGMEPIQNFMVCSRPDNRT